MVDVFIVIPYRPYELPCRRRDFGMAKDDTACASGRAIVPIDNNIVIDMKAWAT